MDAGRGLPGVDRGHEGPFRRESCAQAHVLVYSLNVEGYFGPYDAREQGERLLSFARSTQFMVRCNKEIQVLGGIAV